MAINQRLRAVVDFLIKSERVYNQKDFCKKVDGNDSVISGVLTGKRPFNDGLVKKVCTSFPEINPAFLTDVDCTEMLRPVDDHSTTGNFSRNVFSSIKTAGDKDLVAVIQKQQEQIDRLLAIIEKLTK